MKLEYHKELAYAGNWLTQLGTAINNPVSVDFIASNLPDGRLKTTNLARAANAGGLVTWKGQPAAIPGYVLNYALLSTNIMVPSTAIYNLRNLETDLIQVLTPASGGVAIPQKFNGSTRWNSVSGHFEIDASATQPAWSDIGSGPGPITPDVPHTLVIKYQYDLTNLWTSVLSIQWDAVVYPIPTALQKVGVQTDSWKQVWAVQAQDAASQPGSVEVIYDQWYLAFSDQPF